MKRIYRLQTLLDIVIWGSAIIIGIVIIIFIFALVTNDFSSINITQFEKNMGEITNWEKIIVGLNAAGYALFFWGLLKLKTLVSHFVKRHFFSPATINLLKQIGLLFLFSAIIAMVPTYFYQLFSNGNFRISGVEPGSLLFLLIIGLFFRILGYLFQEAENFQEDSELSI